MRDGLCILDVESTAVPPRVTGFFMAREAIIERLAKLDTCAVSDALDSLNLKGATWGVRPQWQCPRIVGRAVTMKIKPAGLQQSAQHLGTAPIEEAQPGDIIVIDNGGKLEFSC